MISGVPALVVAVSVRTDRREASEPYSTGKTSVIRLEQLPEYRPESYLDLMDGMICSVGFSGAPGKTEKPVRRTRGSRDEDAVLRCV